MPSTESRRRPKKGILTGVEMPDFQPGQVWRMGTHLYRILDAPERARLWTSEATGRGVLSERVRVTQLDCTEDEAEGGHYLDESCFADMERVNA